jgi:poly(A) polymerase
MRARKDAARPLTGHEVMRELGLKPGPLVGEVLRAVAEAAALGRIRDRSGALREARRALAAAGRSGGGARRA